MTKLSQSLISHEIHQSYLRKVCPKSKKILEVQNTYTLFDHSLLLFGNEFLIIELDGGLFLFI